MEFSSTYNDGGGQGGNGGDDQGIYGDDRGSRRNDPKMLKSSFRLDQNGKGRKSAKGDKKKGCC